MKSETPKTKHELKAKLGWMCLDDYEDTSHKRIDSTIKAKKLRKQRGSFKSWKSACFCQKAVLTMKLEPQKKSLHTILKIKTRWYNTI